MMHISFWFGTDLGTFMLPGYVVTSVGGLIGVCMTMIAVAIVYEAMKTLQIYLHRLTKDSLSSDIFQSINNNSRLSRVFPKLPKFSNNYRCLGIAQWTLEVLHYSLHTTIGYILMLAVMTYNVYICLALMIGSTIGYWIFAPSLLNLNMSELHERYKTIPSCSPECGDAIVTSEQRPLTSRIAPVPSVSEISVEIHTNGLSGS